MTRYPRQVDREYLSCRSGGLNKIQMIDGGTPDLDQDLVACNRRRRYIVEHQLPTVFQQSDSFHARTSFSTHNLRTQATLDVTSAAHGVAISCRRSEFHLSPPDRPGTPGERRRCPVGFCT